MSVTLVNALGGIIHRCVQVTRPRARPVQRIAAAVATVAPRPRPLRRAAQVLLVCSGAAAPLPLLPAPAPPLPLPPPWPAMHLPFGLGEGPPVTLMALPLGGIGGFLPDSGDPPGPGSRIIDPDPPATVPEPAALALFGLGLLGLAWVRRGLR
jgi:hypothetical protein